MAADCELLHLLFPIPLIMLLTIVVMILRVYAMWNRSKMILYVLLFIYVPLVIVFFVLRGIYNNPNTYLSGMSQAKLHILLQPHICGLSFSPATVVQVMNFSFCQISLSNVPALLDLYATIPRFVLGAILLVLAVIPTLKQSVEMYRATKQWHPNKYIQQLVRDGILYFLV